RLICEAFDSRIIAVRGNQRGQRQDQVPRRTIHAGLVAGMDVELRPTSPSLAAGHYFAFDHALRSQRDRHVSVESLRGRRHEYANSSAHWGHDLGPAYSLPRVWRPDLFLSLI